VTARNLALRARLAASNPPSRRIVATFFTSLQDPKKILCVTICGLFFGQFALRTLSGV
jgi:hypothetical protein